MLAAGSVPRHTILRLRCQTVRDKRACAMQHKLASCERARVLGVDLLRCTLTARRKTAKFEDAAHLRLLNYKHPVEHCQETCKASKTCTVLQQPGSLSAWYNRHACLDSTAVRNISRQAGTFSQNIS